LGFGESGIQRKNPAKFQSNAQVRAKSGVKMSKKLQKFTKIYKNSQKLAKMDHF
jgi:hypothetical protein